MAAKGPRLRVLTPLTTRLISMIHELEDGCRSMSRTNPDELVALT